MENADPAELLRGMPILRVLPREELAALPWERVERLAGEPFFQQGEPADAAYGIITGRVKVTKQAVGGREVILEVLGPGDLIAVVAILRGAALPASGVPLEDTACVKVDAKAFKQTIERHPGLSQKMLDHVSRRLLEAGQARLSLATDPVEVRLAQALLHLAEKFGATRNGELVFSQAFTRQNLADLAGTTVETAIRVMSRWTKEGWVRSNASRISIAKPEELRKLVRGDTR